MNKHLSLVLTAIIFIAMLISCKAKEEKQPEQQPVPVESVVVDTIPTDTVVEEVVTEPEIPKPDNKYFLIAASFKSETNADNYRNKLISEGYDSEVIIRKVGLNQDFYKVSFKGFYDKDEAFQALRSEMRRGTFQDVWLLIKK